MRAAASTVLLPLTLAASPPRGVHWDAGVGLGVHWAAPSIPGVGMSGGFGWRTRCAVLCPHSAPIVRQRWPACALRHSLPCSGPPAGLRTPQCSPPPGWAACQLAWESTSSSGCPWSSTSTRQQSRCAPGCAAQGRAGLGIPHATMRECTTGSSQDAEGHVACACPAACPVSCRLPQSPWHVPVTSPLLPTHSGLPAGVCISLRPICQQSCPDGARPSHPPGRSI